MEGQMTSQEREFLYRAAFDHLSSVSSGTVLEVGTWKGGGSTLQISTAIMDAAALGKSHELHTCEVDTQLHAEAVGAYRSTPLFKYITFHNKPSTALITELISSGKVPQFVFFDGPEDPDLNLSDFLLLDKHLQVGARFCMHDWDLDVRIDGLISVKAQLLRPFLEGSSSWRQIGSLSKPVSVGIVLFEKVAV